MKLGVFTPVFGTMKLDEVLVKVRALEHVHALELGTGGWPGSDHIDLDALLDKKSCADAYRKKIEDAGLTISALSCHNNPLHPDAATARTADDVLRKTVRLAEQLEVPVVVTFAPMLVVPVALDTLMLVSAVPPPTMPVNVLLPLPEIVSVCAPLSVLP